MKFIKYSLLTLVFVGLLLASAGKPGIFAQGIDPALKYKNVHLWVNPEYDDTRLLVMMQGQIDGVTAPVAVTFLVPTAAEMYSAGSIDTSGKYTGGPPDRVASSVAGWDEISYTLTTGTFRVEYYDPVIVGETSKNISYEFRSPVQITQLDIFIQQPKSTSNFTVSPAGQTGKDGEGFNIQTFSYATLEAQKPLNFEISYVKTNLTIILVVIMFGILGVGIGGFLWWRVKSAKNKRLKRNRTANVAVKSASAGKLQGKRFCPECGELTTSTKFCPNCGAKL